MTKRKGDRGLDFEALRHAIERCDLNLLPDFYAEDAHLSIVNGDAQRSMPFELCGKGEIAKHLRAVYGQGASHRIKGEVVDEDLVTFWEACKYPDGGRVLVETTLEVHGGKIVRQADVVVKHAQSDPEKEVSRGPPRGQPRTTRANTPTVAPPGGRRSSARSPYTLQAGNRKGGSKMMSSVSSVVKRHPLITFFVLSYALSWLAWPVWALGLYPISPVFSFGPFLAALVVLAITNGETGVGGLLRRMVRWRVGLRWYAVALLLPAGLALAATVLNVLLGAQVPSSAELGGWSALLLVFFVSLLIPGLGGVWEEPGWRGFAFPRLQSGRSALFASLILGVLIAGWHLPLMFVGQVHY